MFTSVFVYGWFCSVRTDSWRCPARAIVNDRTGVSGPKGADGYSVPEAREDTTVRSKLLVYTYQRLVIRTVALCFSRLDEQQRLVAGWLGHVCSG